MGVLPVFGKIELAPQARPPPLVVHRQTALTANAIWAAAAWLLT